MFFLSFTSPLKAQKLTNGGFETGARDIPDGWDRTYTDYLADTRETIIFEWDNRIKHSGNHSVSIEILKNFPPYAIWYNWNTSVTEVDAGATYEVSAWVKTYKLKDSAWLYVACWKSLLGYGKRFIDENLLKEERVGIDGTKDWTRVKTNIKVPRGTRLMRINLAVTTVLNRGCKVWFDDIEIRKLSK